MWNPRLTKISSEISKFTALQIVICHSANRLKCGRNAVGRIDVRASGETTTIPVRKTVYSPQLLSKIVDNKSLLQWADIFVLRVSNLSRGRGMGWMEARKKASFHSPI